MDINYFKICFYNSFDKMHYLVMLLEMAPFLKWKDGDL